MTALKGIIIQE